MRASKMLHRFNRVEESLAQLRICGEPLGSSIIQRNSDGIGWEVGVFVRVRMSLVLNKVISSHMVAELLRRRLAGPIWHELGGDSPFLLPLNCLLYTSPSPRD